MSNTQLVVSSATELTKFLNTGKGAVALALPKHLNPDRMLRLAVTAFSTTPKLRECTAQSILASIVVAAQIGLEPGVAGQGYLIPYYDSKNRVNICTFVPGWQGLVGLLNNSGRATAWTGAVFEGDEFAYELGSTPRLFHKPGDKAGDPEKMTHVYSCGKVNGSEMPVVECWGIGRVWAHRDRYNKVGERHYSFKHPEMYARKVVLLQVLKYMPRSIELNNAIVAADASAMGRTTKAEDGVVIEIESESEPMPAGNVGNGGTVTEQAAAEKAAKASEPKTGPTAEELLAMLVGMGGKINAGKAKIEKVAIGLKLMEPSEKLDKLDAKRLAALIDAWEGENGIADTIAQQAQT